MREINAALVIPGLLTGLSSLGEEDWSPFRPGVFVRWLYQSTGDGPAAALLRYEPGASIPRHEHLGFEHILVLQGSQSDERGDYSRGTLVVNPPGTSHTVTSKDGCIVLIIWERGVRFAEPVPPPVTAPVQR